MTVSMLELALVTAMAYLSFHELLRAAVLERTLRSAPQLQLL